MSLIRKIISGGQAGVDRGAIEAALELGFPYGGLIPKGRLAEDGLVPLKFSCMTEDTRKYSLHLAEQNIINSDATLILSRTLEQTDDAKRIEELCKKCGKPYWIDNPEQPNVTDRGFEFLYWIEAEFGERGIVLNVAGLSESRDEGIQAVTRSFVNRILSEPGVSDTTSIPKIISKSPFVKEDDEDYGYGWWFRAVDPVSGQLIKSAIWPGGLLRSLVEERGADELLTCTCGVPGCAGFSHETFERTAKYVRWSFTFGDNVHTLYFDRSVYVRGAITMLQDVYSTKEGWQFVFGEYNSYEDFKAAVDEFLAANPHFKTIWAEIEEKKTLSDKGQSAHTLKE